METINVKYNHTYNDVINIIKKHIRSGASNLTVQKIALQASKINNVFEQEKFVFDSVYDLAVFRASPMNRQQLRTVENIIRTQEANCTGYTTLIGSIFENLKIPYKLRLVDTDGSGFAHIYIVTNNNVLDCILSQKQDDTETFKNRIDGLFNFETEFKRKKDFTMITTINGRIRQKKVINRNVNGFWDTILTPILGDECLLQCNVAYASDETTRQECKLACDNGMTLRQFRQWKEAGGTNLPLPNVISPYGSGMSSDTKTMLYVGGGILVTYLLLRKK